MNTIYRGITTLMVSAVTGKKRHLPKDFSLESILQIIRKQALVPIIFQGALNCGISAKDPVMVQLMQQYFKHVVHSEKQMRALQQLFAAFEENGIDYLPLKGCRMKALYPKPELRPMGDADILIRMEQYGEAESVMETLGFTMTYKGVNDNMWRCEALTVELHWSLFHTGVQALHQYFGSGWDRAVKENGCRYGFSSEDTFVYQFAHMAKHYQLSGIGGRHILDLYVYMCANPYLDEVYVETELEKLHLLTFYRNIRRVICVWFEDGTADEITDYITTYVFSSGSWGTLDNVLTTKELHRSLKEGEVHNSRWKSLLDLIFPPIEVLNRKYPILQRAPWILPVVWVARWIETMWKRRWIIGKKMSAAARVTDEKVLARQQALRYVGLEYEYNVE